MTNKSNKPIAGYYLLMILSAVDNKFDVNEDLIIRDWLLTQFPFKVNLDKELEVISAINPADFMEYFDKAMDDFYMDSDEKERKELVSFAIKLAKSDRIITKEENVFLNELFEKWDLANDSF